MNGLNMPECVSSEKLWLFLADQLDANSAASIAQHIDQCSDCQETLNGLTDLSGLHWNKNPEPRRDTTSLESQITGLIKHPPLLTAQQPDPGSLDLTFLSPSDDQNELGTLIHYRIKRVLGSGGMGVVFQAYDTELRREVAIKVFRPRAASEEQEKRFMREARAVAGVRNDYIGEGMKKFGWENLYQRIIV